MLTPPPVSPVWTLEREELAAPMVGPPAAGPPRSRRWWRVLRAVLLVILLPVIALGVGLLIAYLAHLIRNGGSSSALPPAPSASSSPSPRPSALPSPQVVAVPAGWIAEVSPPAGLTYRHPASWIRRTSSPEVFRFEPASPGSQSPGVEGVGAGFESFTGPADALRGFAARAYSSEPRFVGGALTPVVGQHPEEEQEVVTYSRSGAAVRVVLHSFRSQGHTVLVVGRSLNAQPARAALLEAQVEASLTFRS